MTKNSFVNMEVTPFLENIAFLKQSFTVTVMNLSKQLNYYHDD